MSAARLTWLALFAIGFCDASAAFAGSVVVVVSSDLGPYIATAAGFRAGYPGHVVEVRLQK